jgi:1-deoxy-D-xylulose-5-phosphate synthase
MPGAPRRRGDPARHVAIIGDGAMTAGQAFEALNHAGDLAPDLLVVLNDNRMSISENVGAMTRSATRAAVHPGGPGEAGSSWHRDGGFVPARLFEELGFRYAGPVDGHDLPALLAALRALKDERGPRLLHVLTTKGKGYPPAERAQVAFHAVGPFDPLTGVALKAGRATPTYTDVFSDWICDMAAADPRLYAITPAMREGSGLVRFSREYPDRYFDVAIAEQHAVTFAAGLACAGAKPVVAIYSTFLQRAYDQLIHDVALQDLDVTFAVDRAGLVGPDGATHAGSFDLSYLRAIPNMLVIAPSSEDECRRALTTAFLHEGPAAVRYPRGSGTGVAPAAELTALPIGKATVRRRGQGIALLAFGPMLEPAARVAEALDASLVDMRFVKPLDEALLLELAASHAALVTIEDNAIMGGAGSAVGECLAAHGVGASLLQLGLSDRFLGHATREELLALEGLDAAGIEARVRARFAGLLPPTSLRSAV